MSECNTYTGDLLIKIDDNGDWDINYFNGQACMTDSFDTMVLLSVFGDPDFWQNELTNDPAEQYISEFPEVIKNGKVNNETLKDGVSAIRKSLQFMVNSGMALSIDVSGSVISVYGLSWEIEILRDDSSVKYSIIWEKGVISSAANNTNS